MQNYKNGYHKGRSFALASHPLNPNVVALTIRLGFWGPLYYNHTKGPLEKSISNY